MYATKDTPTLRKPSIAGCKNHIEAARDRLEVISGQFFMAEDQALRRVSVVTNMCDQDIAKHGQVIASTWALASAEIRAAELDYITAMEQAKAAYEIEFSRMARAVKAGIYGATK